VKNSPSPDKLISETPFFLLSKAKEAFVMGVRKPVQPERTILILAKHCHYIFPIGKKIRSKSEKEEQNT